MLKKVNTENIVMTPQPNVRIKLNELNKILDEMKQGEEAVKKLAEMDASLGMQDPVQVARRLRGDRKSEPVVQATGDALGDQALANNLRQQAEKMDREAKGLMAEAQRLLKEAAGLDPAKPEKSVKVTAKTTATKAKKPKTKVTA
jgi:hypothetical protein